MEVVEKEFERVVKRQKTFHSSTQVTIDRLLQQLEFTKKALENGTPGGVELAAQKKLRDASLEIQSGMKEYYGAMNKYSKSIEKKFNSNLDLAGVKEAFTGKEQYLSEAIALHLIRTGSSLAAQQLCLESQLTLPPSLQSQFSDMFQIVDSLERGDASSALRWAHGRRAELEAKGSHLEFELHRVVFMKILTGSTAAPAKNIMLALEYAKREFAPFGDKYLKDIQRLMCSMLYITPKPKYLQPTSKTPKSPLAESPYADLASHSHWASLQSQFTRDYCALLGLSNDPPLHVCVNIGATAIPTMIKLRSLMDDSKKERPKVEMWSVSDELPVEIPVPKKSKYHSIFACPVSREQTTPSNPPMMLTCGHIISRESLVRLAKGTKNVSRAPPPAAPGAPSSGNASGGNNGGVGAQGGNGQGQVEDPFLGVNMSAKVKCPYCPTEAPVGHALRVSF